MTSLAAFYTDLEAAWRSIGLTIQKRECIVPGEPAHGWRWTLADEHGRKLQVSFNAEHLFPRGKDDPKPERSAWETIEILRDQVAGEMNCKDAKNARP